MARKSKSNPSGPRKILLEALNHPEFINDLPLLTLENNQLLGVIVVNEVDRVSLLTSAFEEYKSLEYKGEEPVVVFMIPNRFSHQDNCQKFNFKTGYSVYFDEYDFNTRADESLSTIFVLKKGHSSIGFFMLDLELSQFDNSLIFKIGLEYIYVNKKNRNKVNWLNLTTALTKFLTVLLECLIQVLDDKQKLDMVLQAVFISRAGAKIGIAVYNEINYIWDFLQDSYPKHKSCFGNFTFERD